MGIPVSGAEVGMSGELTLAGIWTLAVVAVGKKLLFFRLGDAASKKARDF